jgi:hypothetical protein
VGGFGEHAPHGVLALTGVLTGVALLSTGIGMLARSPLLRSARRGEQGRGEPGRGGPAGRERRGQPCLACHQ